MNKALLRHEMEKRGVSTAEMAKKLGISRSAFWKKCNGISEFKLSEIMIITETLKLGKLPNVFYDDEE